MCPALSRQLALALACVASLGLQALPARAADLTVSAAASLTNAFKDLAPAFEAANTGTKVQLNFAASGPLLQQIAKGAPVDVFASADQETMDQAQAQGLVKAEQRRNFVSNALVLVVPAAAAKLPAGLKDLAQPAVTRVAIGLPASVPVGRYTKAVLEAEGLWAAVEPKMIGAQNVRQALDYVARGEVDAGFVYATDAKQGGDKVKTVVEVPVETPVTYPIAVLEAAKDKKDAAAFVAFVTGPKGQAVLAKYGFKKP